MRCGRGEVWIQETDGMNQESRKAGKKRMNLEAMKPGKEPARNGAMKSDSETRCLFLL
jgi:hypothetical protein